jgi:hypothetical protein
VRRCCRTKTHRRDSHRLRQNDVHTTSRCCII